MLTQHIQETLEVWPGPFPDFLGGAWGWGYWPVNVSRGTMQELSFAKIHAGRVA